MGCTVPAMIMHQPETIQTPLHLTPAQCNIIDFQLPHGTQKHALEGFIRDFESCVEAFLRCHRAGAENFLPVDGILEILERGGVIVRICHGS